MPLSLEVVGAFLGISILLFLVGSLMLWLGRNRAQDYLEASSGKSLGVFTKLFAYMIPIANESRDKLQSELVKAGHYGKYAAEDYLALRNAAVFAWLIFVAVALVLTINDGPAAQQFYFIVGGVVLLLIWGLPRIILSTSASARVQRIRYGLPDGLDMVTMTVSAGMPLQRAIAHVSRELRSSHNDLACELTILEGQASARSLDYALKEFAKRVDDPDVTALSTMIHHAERLGGNVANAFHEFADSIRETRRQRAEEEGNRTSIKLLFPVIFFLAPPIYVLLLGPAVMELRNFSYRETAPGGALNQSATQSAISAAPEQQNGFSPTGN
ncbi:type II secretion system F family protein [Bremerella sp. P1]|uniref:type II secretion system F family protein n=1 Tax=Bremerella sp. P1 TaxID=3026424 RepID=UPI00236801C2|nr:type II secretion system F family protein [Bremerella sp. P1]WDI40788.1 type II secretion system F family protein [Bremerella sp. P1]